MVELKINSYTDREKLIVVLVNSGYTVRVEERPDPKRYLGKEYYVIIEDAEYKNEKDEFKVKTSTIEGIKETLTFVQRGRCPNEDHPCYCTGACLGMDNTGAKPLYNYVEAQNQ